jgi:hypothetical protein
VNTKGIQKSGIANIARTYGIIIQGTRTDMAKIIPKTLFFHVLGLLEIIEIFRAQFHRFALK